MPRYIMGDGAQAISKAGKEAFGSIGQYSRLMCWSHTHRAIVPQLKSISTVNKSVSDKILKDIMDIHWSALNEGTFRKSFIILGKKYDGKYDAVLNSLINKFFSYMHKVRIDSEEFL
jgi:hypothetical protein